MKTIKQILIIVLSVINFSCSSDDDSSSLEQAYFPTLISSVDAGSASPINMNIEYDTSNRISEFSFVNGPNINTFETNYDSNGLTSSIIQIRNDGTTVDFMFSYSNNKVSLLTISNGSSSTPFNVTFNELNNTYTFSPESNPVSYKYDASGNIIDLTGSFGAIVFSYNSNEGVYKNISDSLPFMLVMSIVSTSSLLFDSLIFASKQLTGISAFGNNISTQTTRNEQNQIETIQFIDATSFTIESTTSIEYELRTLN